MSLPASRSHRTALFVNVSVDSSFGFRNRTARLLESLNGTNIKVDIYSVDPQGRISVGLNFPTEAPDVNVDLVALATEAGYTQALISTQAR